MGDYTLTVGLEIHAELATRTKMFCSSLNNPDEDRPNLNVCPICLGYPGTLPVINKKAVESVLRLGAAVGGEIANYTEFDRKNYFYPDIPKGYQISQYKFPLVRGGELAGVSLTRVHLEEDTARSIHSESGESLVDFNRAGVPLLELVTEPVIHDPNSAAEFAKELQLLLIYLGIAEANMEKGEMRIEANVSVGPAGKLGTKVEIKNLNSFRSVERAIEFEFERQKAILEGGGKVDQETRGWQEDRGETFSQRVKEESHDYRYFPDPDLPKLFLSENAEFSPHFLETSLPELPWQMRDRFVKELGLKAGDVEIYIRDRDKAELLEAVSKELADVNLTQLASNYITSDLKNIVPATELAETIRMISAGDISSRGAKEILKLLEAQGGKARDIAEKNNLIQKSNADELKSVVEKIIKENEKAVKEFREGKSASLQFLVGQAMKETKGSANPQVLKEIFEANLRA